MHYIADLVVGDYSYLNTDIPPLWLAYLGDPSDSGKSVNTYLHKF